MDNILTGGISSCFHVLSTLLGLSRTCIIGTDPLEQIKTVIDLSQHRFTFQKLEGNPSIKLHKDEEIFEGEKIIMK